MVVEFFHQFVTDKSVLYFQRHVFKVLLYLCIRDAVVGEVAVNVAHV